MADDLATLQQQVAQMQKTLAVLTAGAATTQPVRRSFYEMTFAGPKRHKARAATALDDAGYTQQTVTEAGDLATITVEVDWTRQGPVGGDFQTRHLAKATDAVEPYDYTLRMSGLLAGYATRS